MLLRLFARSSHLVYRLVSSISVGLVARGADLVRCIHTNPIGLMQKYPPIFFFSMFQVFIETKYD